MRKIIKNINMQQVDVLTIVGEDYQDIYKANKITGKRAHFKNRRTKYIANECPSRCLINQNHDNGAIQSLYWKHANGIYHK